MRYFMPWSIAIFFLFTIIALAVILDGKNSKLQALEELGLIAYHFPTEDEFNADKDILQLWYNEHGLENYTPMSRQWITDGKGSWKFNMKIKRPYVGQDFRGITWRRLSDD